MNFLLNLRFSRAFYLLQFKFAKTDATGNNRIYHLEESLAEALVHFANVISKKGKKRTRVQVIVFIARRNFPQDVSTFRANWTDAQKQVYCSEKQGRKKQVQEKLQKKHCCWDVACIQCRPKLSTSCPFTVTTKITLSKKRRLRCPFVTKKWGCNRNNVLVQRIF